MFANNGISAGLSRRGLVAVGTIGGGIEYYSYSL